MLLDFRLCRPSTFMASWTLFTHPSSRKPSALTIGGLSIPSFCSFTKTKILQNKAYSFLCFAPFICFRTFVIPLECTSIQYTTRKGFFTSQLMPVQNKGEFWQRLAFSITAKSGLLHSKEKKKI